MHAFIYLVGLILIALLCCVVLVISTYEWVLCTDRYLACKGFEVLRAAWASA